tara:strand:+ start:3858 stop:6143 length:2286 start_codon:yes stop_codon:yes gene_type:complete
MSVNPFENNVIFVSGPTGSGKSTGVPQQLLEAYPSSKIIVSQPRRIGVWSLYERMLNIVGELVGMRMGFGVREDNPATRLWYMTTGYLVRFLIGNPDFLVSGDFLVLDEIHEKSLDADLSCYLARKLINKGVKLVIMSATFEYGRFRKYFMEDNTSLTEGTLKMGSRPFPNAIYHLDELEEHPDFRLSHFRKVLYRYEIPMSKQLEIAIDLIQQIGEPVLVFLPGLSQLFDAAGKLDDLGYTCICLHSQLNYDFSAFESSDDKKVILATNVAESSITIPDINWVIDLGREKFVKDNILKSRMVSQASAIQRAGRTGRVRPGTVLRLYSSELYANMPSYHVEYSAGNLCQIILQLKLYLSNEDPREILSLFPTPPVEDDVNEAFDLLVDEYNMLNDDEENTINDLGRFGARIGFDPKYVLMLVCGIQLGCAYQVAELVASMLQRSFLRISPLDADYRKKVKKYCQKRQEISPISESLFNLHENKKKKRVKRVISQIQSDLTALGIKEDKHVVSDSILRAIIYACFRENALEATASKPALTEWISIEDETADLIKDIIKPEELKLNKVWLSDLDPRQIIIRLETMTIIETRSFWHKGILHTWSGTDYKKTRLGKKKFNILPYDLFAWFTDNKLYFTGKSNFLNGTLMPKETINWFCMDGQQTSLAARILHYTGEISLPPPARPLYQLAITGAFASIPEWEETHRNEDNSKYIDAVSTSYLDTGGRIRAFEITFVSPEEKDIALKLMEQTDLEYNSQLSQNILT